MVSLKNQFLQKVNKSSRSTNVMIQKKQKYLLNSNIFAERRTYVRTYVLVER